MKTIEERAINYANKLWNELDDFNEDHGTFENIVTDAYIEGVKAERAELLRWRDPEEELPVNSKMVLVKLSNDCYGVAEYSGRSWCFNGEAPEGKVIGWRPIGEFNYNLL